MNSLRYLAMKCQAMGWLVLGRVDPARELFDRMLQAWPGDPYALSSRAHLLAQQGHRQEALADLETLVRHHGHLAGHWFNYGYLLEELGRWDEALVAFRRATELDPLLDRAWYGMGLVLIRLQRLDDAVAALKRNTELQPMSPYGWYQLARVHVDRQQPDEAVKVIRHLKGFEPKVAAQLERETGLVAGRPVA